MAITNNNAQSVSWTDGIQHAIEHIQSDTNKVFQDIFDKVAPTGPINPDLQPVEPGINPPPVRPGFVDPSQPVGPGFVDPSQPVEPGYEPTPMNPMPIHPGPMNPTPIDPYEPTPVNPMPIHPGPMNPTPIDPYEPMPVSDGQIDPKTFADAINAKQQVRGKEFDELFGNSDSTGKENDFDTGASV